MAGIIAGKVCCLGFNNSSVIPKMLGCGHSFCSPCITEVIKSNPVCPKCRQTIESTEASLPVNYSILEAVEALKNLGPLDKDSTFMRSTETIRKYLEMKDVLIQRKSDVESSLPIIENGIKKLKELDNKTPFPKANEILTELEKDYKKVEQVFHYKSIKNPFFLPTISLNDFEDKPSCLITIYNRIRNGDEIYTAHQVKNDIKYGQISLFDNKLFFHSLSLSEVPQEASLIAFADVKKCQISDPYVFLNIRVNEKELIYTLVIEMYHRNMCEGFVVFCTGECGYSYKDSPYTNGRDRLSNHCNVLHVEKTGENLSLTDYKIDGEELTETAFSGSENDMFLYLEPDGTFDIYSLRCEGSVIEFAYGKVVLPKEKIPITYSDSSFLKITECGLVFNL